MDHVVVRNNMTVFDGHSDLLYDVCQHRLAGETHVLEHYHLDNLRRGGVEGLVLALWVSRTDNSFWYQIPGAQTDAERMELMLRCTREELAECSDMVLVRTVEEAEQVKAAGKIYAFLGVEGMASIGADLSGIDCYAELGAKLAMLTWNEENALATGAGGDRDRGLTDCGKRAVRRMQDRGMLIDVSHLNDGGFRDVMKLTQGPVIASHSNCRALCDVRRNLDDDQLRAIRDTGGIVGLNVYHNFVHEDPEQQTVEMLARHAVHMVEVMGIEHVACGFDFCEFMGDPGVTGLDNCSCIPKIFRALKELGMTEEEQRLMARENFLRLLNEKVSTAC